VTVASFVWAGIRIDHNTNYQRQNWQAVAHALGPARRTRAIVAYEGTFATAPLPHYLPGVSWASGSQDPQPDQTTPVTVREVDVVGNTFQRPPTTPATGTRLIGSSRTSGFQIERYLVSPAWHASPEQIAERAPSLLGPAAPGAARVLVQRPG
jgi:hypothetical protein